MAAAVGERASRRRAPRLARPGDISNLLSRSGVGVGVVGGGGGLASSGGAPSAVLCAHDARQRQTRGRAPAAQAAKLLILCLALLGPGARTPQLCPDAVCRRAPEIGPAQLGPLLARAAAAAAAPQATPTPAADKPIAGAGWGAGQGQRPPNSGDNNNNETTEAGARANTTTATAAAAAAAAAATETGAPHADSDTDTARPGAGSRAHEQVATNGTRRESDANDKLKEVDLNLAGPARRDSDLGLIMTKQSASARRQQQQQQEPPGELAGRPTSARVVCNSRARCVQLELAAGGGEPARADPAQAARQPTRDKKKAGELAGAERAPEWMPPMGAERAAASAATAPTAASNKIALIEFSKDYSFDELDDSDATAAAAAAAATDDDDKTSARSAHAPAGPAERTGNETHHAAEEPAGARAPPTPGGSAERPAAAAGARAPQPPAPATIWHANDQSKVVNVRTSEPRAPAAGPTQALLSIKDNKPGPAHRLDGGAAGAVAVAAPAAASLERGLSSLQVTSDKISQFGGGGVVAPREQAAAAAAAATATGMLPSTFYPYLGGVHHASHARARHKLVEGSLGGGGGNGGGAGSSDGRSASAFSLAALLGDNQQMSLAGGAPSAPGARHQSADSEPPMPPIVRIAPLRTLNASRALVGTHEGGSQAATAALLLRRLLLDLAAQRSQSLVLSHNKLKFDTWAQLYGLLAVHLRRSLYQLDLSHNSLAKLGVTFTGYIEHHLAHQLLVQRNQSWPFASSGAGGGLAQNSTTGHHHHQQQQQQQQQLKPLEAAPRRQQQQQQSQQPSQSAHQQLLRHPNLGEGKLYNAVRSELPLEPDSLLVQQQPSQQPAIATSLATANQTAGGGAEPPTTIVHRRPGSARVPQTVLHLAARLKALDLSYNKLEWLINDQFRVLKHAESIRLDHNQIRYIHQQAFNGLEELKYLNLNHNRIQTIYMEQFQTNFNLRALFLQSNYLTYLRAGSLASLDNLRRLDLSRNKFSLLSNNAFAGLDSLEFLNLSSNQFVHVPSTSFHSLAGTLRRLDLGRNQLAQLMPGTFFHLKLEQLWLDESAQLVAIDRGAFWDLPYLSELSLRASQMLLSVNSQAFVGLPSLRSINYDDCPLLDAEARQTLDNATLAATLRQLTAKATAAAAAAATTSPTDPLGVHSLTQQQLQRAQTNATAHESPQVAPAANGTTQPTASRPDSMRLQMEPPGAGAGAASSHAHKWPAALKWPNVKFVYPLGCLLLIVIALKLAFSFTGCTTADRRRRRRRVYQASVSSLSSASGSSGAGGCARSPARTPASPLSLAGDFCDLGAGGGSGGANDELDDESQQAAGAFALCEQQPHNVLAGAAGERRAACAGDEPQPQPQPPSAEPAPEILGQQQDACACPECVGGARAAELQTTPDRAPHDADQERAVQEQGQGQRPGQADERGPFHDGNNCCDIQANTSGTEATQGALAAADATPTNSDPRAEATPAAVTLDLIHDQLVAAGYDYGHAKCAHFYQSLGPALHLADMTANLVNQMDYYS